MIFEMKGRIKQMLNERSGESAKGPWHSADFIVEEIYGNYINKVVVNAFGDELIEQGKLLINSQVETTVAVQIGAREYNGRFYNDVRVREFAGMKAVPAQQPAPAPSTQQSDEPGEDLPF